MPWKRILGTAATLFAIDMAVILAFELATGRAVSPFTGGSSTNGGGTSIPGFSGIRTDTDGSDTEQQKQDQAPAPGQSPSQDQEPTELDTPEEDQEPTPAQEVPAVPETTAVPAPAPEQSAEPKQDPGQQVGSNSTTSVRLRP